MNKTIDINLAGIFFHIDEKAYALLKKYLDALRNTFAKTTGKEEILADIEARIAELLRDRKSTKEQVIEIEDIEAIIAILGQPEDYVISGEDEEAPQQSNSKKLFRDTEDSYVSGVASGLAHYFGLDVGWLRIIWALLFFFSGGSFLVIYILFWVLTPEASTTAEKLQMKGEPVTVGNIEKKIKEEVNAIADKVKNVDYNKAGSTLKKKSKSFFDNFASLILSLIKVAGKLIGLFLVIIASLSLFGITLGFIVTNIVGWITEMPFEFIDVALFQNLPFWILSILVLCGVGIPMLFLLMVGIKLLAPRSNPFGFWGRLILLGLWLLSLISLIVLGTIEAKSHRFSYQAFENYSHAVSPSDTLRFSVSNEPQFKDRLTHSSDFDVIIDEEGDKHLLLQNVTFKIEPTDRDSLYLSIQKEANGASYKDAQANAQQINYAPIVDSNRIQLNSYLTTPAIKKYKNQEVAITVFVPEKQTVFIDSSVLPILGWNIPNDQNFVRRGLAGHHWNIQGNQLICLDCKPK